MNVTSAMVTAARRAEFDYYQKGRALSTERFIPTPDAVIRVMLEAALALAIPQQGSEAPKRPSIVVAEKPGWRR